MEHLPQPPEQLLQLASLRPARSEPSTGMSAQPMSLARWAEVQMMISATVANEPMG